MYSKQEHRTDDETAEGTPVFGYDSDGIVTNNYLIDMLQGILDLYENKVTQYFNSIRIILNTLTQPILQSSNPEERMPFNDTFDAVNATVDFYLGQHQYPKELATKRTRLEEFRTWYEQCNQFEVLNESLLRLDHILFIVSFECRKTSTEEKQSKMLSEALQISKTLIRFLEDHRDELKSLSTLVWSLLEACKEFAQATRFNFQENPEDKVLLSTLDQLRIQLSNDEKEKKDFHYESGMQLLGDFRTTYSAVINPETKLEISKALRHSVRTPEAPVSPTPLGQGFNPDEFKDATSPVIGYSIPEVPSDPLMRSRETISPQELILPDSLSELKTSLDRMFVKKDPLKDRAQTSDVFISFDHRGSMPPVLSNADSNEQSSSVQLPSQLSIANILRNQSGSIPTSESGHILNQPEIVVGVRPERGLIEQLIRSESAHLTGKRSLEKHNNIIRALDEITNREEFLGGTTERVEQSIINAVLDEQSPLHHALMIHRYGNKSCFFCCRGESPTKTMRRILTQINQTREYPPNNHLTNE